MMGTFIAHTLTETRITEDQCRFEMTFVDASGESYAISIPSSIAADLVPVLEALTTRQRRAAEFTRLPKQFAVGHASIERMVLMRFDDEPPYAVGIEFAEALSRELREQCEHVSLLRRPAIH
jgi:hypothetical protein